MAARVESISTLFGSDRINLDSEKMNLRYILPSVKYGGGNIKAWGCFSRDGVSPLHRVESNIDWFMYKNIVHIIRLPFAKRNMPRGCISQQDNEPKLTSRHVTDWCSNK
jgi:hypothetical protein